MPQGKEQLFTDFGLFAVKQGYGDTYQPDPHTSIPLNCGYIRFRYPGSGIFTAAGIIRFRQRQDGVTACKEFVAGSNEPLELQMNFPKETPHNFPSPTFANAHVIAQSRWYRWKHAVRGWWS